MKPFLVIFLSTIYSCIGYSQDQIKFFSDKIEYSLPDQTLWKIIKDEAPTNEKKVILMLKHLPFKDSSGNSIEPILAIVYEKVSQHLDVIEYSISILSEKPYNIQRNILGGYPQYSKDKHSIVFKGNYERDGVKHVVLLGYILNDNIGIEIIGDATANIFNLVEKDFIVFIKSVFIKN